MQGAIPILMYHSISNVTGPRSVAVTPPAFTQQMQWLHNQGYRTVTEDQLLGYLRAGAIPPDPLVCLTFDDGYRSWHSHAAPLLADLNYRPVMFLSTRYVGGRYSVQDIETDVDDEPLQWNEVADLAANGWDVRVHGHTHARWTHMSPDHLISEISNCRTEIEQRLGISAGSVAYPYGSYNSVVLEYVSGLGFKCGYSVHTGRMFATADQFRLPRIEVNSTDTLASFQRKVQTGYASPMQAVKAGVRNTLYASRWLKDVLSGNE